MENPFIAVIAGILIAAGSAWITVKLSLSQFRSQKLWEKKVEAYERVIEALHHSKKFSNEYLKAEHKNTELPPEQDEALRSQSKAAHDEISKAADVGALIFSDEAVAILSRFEVETDSSPRFDSWYEYLNHDWLLINRYMSEFIDEAKRDIKDQK